MITEFTKDGEDKHPSHHDQVMWYTNNMNQTLNQSDFLSD